MNEKELITGLPQKEYDRKLIDYATKRISGIHKFLKLYEATSLDKLYKKIHLGRKKLIKKIYISDDEYARRWQSTPYIKKEMQDDGREIYTEKGEKVRSKSEKIIADKLYSLGIPYRYECPLFFEAFYCIRILRYLKCLKEKRVIWNIWGCWMIANI